MKENKAETQTKRIILTWCRENRDQEGGFSKPRPFHRTSVRLKLAIAPNVGNSGTQFFSVGVCVRANPRTINKMTETKCFTSHAYSIDIPQSSYHYLHPHSSDFFLLIDEHIHSCVLKIISLFVQNILISSHFIVYDQYHFFLSYREICTYPFLKFC